MMSVTACNKSLAAPVNLNPFPELPREIGLRIFYYVSNIDVHICCRVSKIWNELGCKIFLQKIAHGSTNWRIQFSGKGECIELSLPDDYNGLIKAADFYYEKSHIAEALNAYQKEALDFDQILNLAKKLDEVGRYLQVIRCPEEAILYHRQSVVMREKCFGGEPDLDVAADLKNL